jgi:endo-1,4-beta-xylanase
MKLTVLLAVLPLVSAVPAKGYYPKPQPRPAPLKYPGLDVLAKRVGLLYFGTAIDNVVLNNTKYISIAHNRSEFGQVTPANGQKWMYIEPKQNVFNFSMGDAIVKPAVRARQMRR